MAIEIHIEKRINNARPVREANVKRQREYLVVTVLAALFVVGLLFYGWQHYRWIQYGYQLEDLQKKKEQLIEVRNRLLLERASLADRGRIDDIARNELGMVSPAEGQWITFSADAPFTIPLPAEALEPELSAKK
jgi:cell division protein FtsL